METRTGSPWHMSRSCPQLHAASWFVIRLALCLKYYVSLQPRAERKLAAIPVADVEQTQKDISGEWRQCANSGHSPTAIQVARRQLRAHRHNRRKNQIPIALAAHPAPNLPATSCPGAFWTPAAGARGAARDAGVQKPAHAKNLHMRRRCRISLTSRPEQLPAARIIPGEQAPLLP